MDLNWYKVFDVSQQTIKTLHAEADNYRLAKQIDKQPSRRGIRLPRLINQPAPASRRLRRALP